MCVCVCVCVDPGVCAVSREPQAAGATEVSPGAAPGELLLSAAEDQHPAGGVLHTPGIHTHTHTHTPVAPKDHLLHVPRGVHFVLSSLSLYLALFCYSLLVLSLHPEFLFYFLLSSISPLSPLPITLLPSHKRSILLPPSIFHPSIFLPSLLLPLARPGPVL